MDRPVKGQKVKGLKAWTNGTNEVDTVVAQVSEQMSEQIKGMVSIMIKRQNTGTSDPPASGKKGKPKPVKQECLAAECGEFTIYSLCPLHYHSLVSAKVPSLKLRNGYGDAYYYGVFRGRCLPAC